MASQMRFGCHHFIHDIINTVTEVTGQGVAVAIICMTARFAHLVDGLKQMAATEVLDIAKQISSPKSDYKEKLDQIQKLQNIPVAADVFPNDEAYKTVFFWFVRLLSLRDYLCLY